MSVRILNRSFSGGEITPELFGRLDLSKVQEALALCMNFITLPHGPVVNRPGTEYVEEVKNSANATRLIPFSYNNTQSFAIQLGAGYFRFHSNGATLNYTTPAAYSAATAYNQGDMCSTGGTNYYCVTANTNQSPVQATWSVVTPYTPGNLVSYNGFTYVCMVANTGQTPTYAIPQNAYWQAAWYAMPANGDYEIPNPYAAADLFNITYTQSADVLTLCNQSYPILELRRYGATNWQLRQVTFGPLIAMPIGSGSAGTPIAHVYGVQAISFTLANMIFQGNASPVAPVTTPVGGSISNDLTQKGAYNILTWNGVPGAIGYNIYKQASGIWYLIGQSQGLSFTDDASRTLSSTTAWAPQGSIGTPTGVTANAFPASGTATAVTAAATVGTGSTVYSYVVTAVDESGNESYQSNIAGVSNNLYTAGNFNTITIPPVAGAARYNVYKLSSGAWGFIGQATTPPSGAIAFLDQNITPDISRTPPQVPANLINSSGNYPGAVTYYQQRRFFGGTAAQVQNVWATRSGTESDMNYTIPSRDDNRLAFKIASREGSAIRHIVALQDLLILSASCEWKCSSTTGVLTPATINVQPQSYIGASNVQPVVVGNAVLYAAARGGHIRQMNYNWQINGYQSTDSSIFAPHLFDYNTIVDMAYCRGPIPVLWCVSSNGKLLGMTYLPEQQIASWHQHTTGASDAFESICTITENNEDMLYCVVRRNINGTTHRFVERMHTRLYNSVADCHYVDCGATYLVPAANTGAYSRTWTTINCSIANHGLSAGQACWLAFSDAALGATPGGLSYTVGSVTDANNFSVNVPTTVAISLAAPGVVTLANHGLAAGAQVMFFTSGALPAGILAATPYYVVNPTDSTFQIAAIPGGAAISTAAPASAVTVSAGSPAVINWSGHGLAAGTAVSFSATGSLPGGISPGATYFVVNPTANAFQIAATPNGATIAATSSGTGTQTCTATQAGTQTCCRVNSAAVAISSAAPALVTWNGHGLAAGAPVMFSTTGALPAGLTAGTTYYVVNPGANSFQLAATPGGAAIATSGTHSGTQTCTGNLGAAGGTVTFLPNVFSRLTWLEGMTVNILADGAVMPPQTVTAGTITLPVGASQVHIGLPLTAQVQTPPAASQLDPALAQGRAKNLNKVFLRTYRSSGILAGPDFADLTPYRQRSTENPGSPPGLVTDEIEIVVSADWGMSGQICIQQSDPLPLDIASMTLEIAVGGGI